MSKITVTKKCERNVKYLLANCGVRYWEDGTVNGVVDDDDNPAMPFASKDAWIIKIDIDTGVIIDWPKGTTADVYYKVCDAGIYSLLDDEGNEVRTIEGYVPSIMCPGGNGYGDYVIMEIDEDGKIANWVPDLSYFEDDAA